MKRLFWIFIITVFFSACSQKEINPHQSISTYYASQVDSLDFGVDHLVSLIKSNAPVADKQSAFRSMRRHWKHIEPLTEYYFGNVSEAINGPALPEEEDYDAKIIEPTGFQVMEELLFPIYDSLQAEPLFVQANIIKATIPRLRQLFESNTITDAGVFEASRLELLRIMSLGISGFDSPVAQLSIDEARDAFEGLRIILSEYPDNAEKTALNSLFVKADELLSAKVDFNSFDRAGFIRSAIIPLSEKLYAYQLSLNIENSPWIRPLDMSKTNIADASLFNVAYFSPQYSQSLKPNDQMIELGHALFFDPLLSGNNLRSCASCHNPDLAFTDGISRSKAFGEKGELFRNAPTLINSAFQKVQFTDSRVAFLEDQITDVMHNPIEMKGDMGETLQKINKSSEYRQMFVQSFPDLSADGEITGKNIQIALASYVRSLRSFNSPFDRFMRGENTLKEEEIRGFNIFMGKGKCATCHFMPLFNGSVPPSYNETESEVLGVPLRNDSVNAKVDADEGRILVSQKSIQRNMFKTSTVRNAALTAPYMHNGVFVTLVEVIDFYNRGGGAGIGIELENQTLPPDPLQLSKSERAELVAFIHALTDTANVGRHPAKLPMTGDSKLDSRKVGGDY